MSERYDQLKPGDLIFVHIGEKLRPCVIESLVLSGDRQCEIYLRPQTGQRDIRDIRHRILVLRAATPWRTAPEKGMTPRELRAADLFYQKRTACLQGAH